jgi:DNA invertase Pin-like site-specific DNA recombinase
MIADNGSFDARPSPQKIAPVHLQRLAVVYVRQSTAQQVLRHEESTRLQYGLVDHARQLGWPEERVLVIDDDLGHSAAEGGQRAGFQRLVSEVSLDHVGMILGVEISRLARSSKDWHQLLEICALFGTLIADSDGICDPSDFNDRMLLGLKGTMSEAELHVMKQRMYQGKLSKARRGELGFDVPTGYVRSSSGEVLFDPDEEVQQVVRLTFGKFEELGTVHALLRYLVAHDVRIGVRVRGGEGKGELQWHAPNQTTLQNILKNPIYAGAYAYGRRRTDPRKRKPGRRSTGRTSPSSGGWHVLLKDRLPAYISWQTYEKNLRQLADNRAVADARGAPRNGNSLLQGLVVCGHCGARMTVNYHGSDKRYSYVCTRQNTVYGGSSCQCLSGAPLDGFAAEKVLQALEPAALELSLEAAKNIEAERAELDGLWQKRMERASYEAERAGRHYRSVEPENRLVARQLARDWERKLAEEQRLKEEYRRFLLGRPRLLSASERESIRRLASDIPALWRASSTTNAERKEIIRQVVERVVVEVEGDSERVGVCIEWAGGRRSAAVVIRPVSSFESLSYYPRLCERVRQLASQGLDSSHIAQCLDAEGYRSAKLAEGFGQQGVQKLMRRLGLSRHQGRQRPPQGLLGEHEWWLGELAEQIGMPKQTLYTWIRRGWVRSRQLTGHARGWVVWADEAELERLRRLHQLPGGYHTHRKWIELRGENDRVPR